MNINGREYSLIRGSDIERNGMYLELYDAPEPNGNPIAEWFYSDTDGSLSFTPYRDEISDSALAWFRKEAARLLPPTDGTV